MKLLNFSVGQIQTIQIGNDTIRTAHVKAPVAEPWIITEDGAANDRRASHPDKIYAFSRESYDYWGAYLKIDPGRWPDGFFGENLTLTSLDEREVRLGDAFALGDEVHLVVAGIRTPCVKLAWRLGQPRTFQKIFAASRNTGVYLGVLETGMVRPGDRLRRIRHDPAMPSLAELADFTAAHSTPPLAAIERVLAFDRLSVTIRHILSAKLDTARRAAARSAGRWLGWRTFLVDRVTDEAPNVRSFLLRPADGKALYQPRPGQFLTVRMDGGAAEPITRTWSLSAYAHAMTTYRLTIRRQEGPGSNWMHRAGVGASVMVRAPAGQFTIDEGGYKPVVLIAAGIGITPLLAMLHAHLARQSGVPIYLIYGVRTQPDLAFREELEALAALHPSFHPTYVFSQSETAGRPAGRITPALVIETLSGLHVMLGGDHRVDLPWSENDTYICGPGSFCTSMKDALVARGANPDHVFHESFAAPERPASEVSDAVVEFRRSGVTCSWSSDDDVTLLEAAEQAGISVQSDCRAGACKTCRVTVLSGATTADTDDGAALLCIGRPSTRILVLDC